VRFEPFKAHRRELVAFDGLRYDALRLGIVLVLVSTRQSQNDNQRAPGDDSARGSMKYWEIIADNLSKAGWSWGCVSARHRSEWRHLDRALHQAATLRGRCRAAAAADSAKTLTLNQL